MNHSMMRVMDATDISEADARWQAVEARDASADGRFVYAVATTMIYCRPSCPSRRPNRGNVAFFDTSEAAAYAGYRPCKRCHPQAGGHPHGAVVAEACRTIEAAEEPPTLEALAAAAGLSPFHFHRVFKAVTGVTPKAYADAARAARLHKTLPQARTVTDAAYDAGFNASSRFYAGSIGTLGMAPGIYRQGGAGEHLRFALASSSLGEVLVAATDKGLCAVEFGPDAETLLRQLQDRFPRAVLEGGDADFDRLVATVIGSIEQPGGTLADLPLDLRGTVFQRRVWQELRRIPAGETASYAAIAMRIGQPSASRAVAGACAANTLAVAVPCHRVVRQDGSLSGYRWGVDRKRALLDREAGRG